jgi:hypothetical protein
MRKTRKKEGWRWRWRKMKKEGLSKIRMTVMPWKRDEFLVLEIQCWPNRIAYQEKDEIVMKKDGEEVSGGRFKVKLVSGWKEKRSSELGAEVKGVLGPKTIVRGLKGGKWKREKKSDLDSEKPERSRWHRK